MSFQARKAARTARVVEFRFGTARIGAASQSRADSLEATDREVPSRPGELKVGLTANRGSGSGLHLLVRPSTY